MIPVLVCMCDLDTHRANVCTLYMCDDETIHSQPTNTYIHTKTDKCVALDTDTENKQKVFKRRRRWYSNACALSLFKLPPLEMRMIAWIINMKLCMYVCDCVYPFWHRTLRLTGIWTTPLSSSRTNQSVCQHVGNIVFSCLSVYSFDFLVVYTHQPHTPRVQLAVCTFFEQHQLRCLNLVYKCVIR